MKALYDQFGDKLPEMYLMDEETMLNYLGISMEDCAQAVVAVTSDGLGADEVWLIQAKDTEALARLQQLARIFSASGLWLTPAETLEMWSGPAAITVETGHETHEGVFYRERLAGYDPYMVFLDGNQPFIRLRNPNGTGRLLLIRDSFASSLAGFLAQSYEEVALVDLRYYKQPISQLAEGFDQILVLYSLENFLTDSNIVLMK